ncbi:MAG: ion transporter [Pirellulaceae bacterium]|nr:ion transporter [Pirellulaceae bacterium]
MNAENSKAVKSPSQRRPRQSQRPDGPSARATIYDIIFGAETPAGWWFDIGLLIAILVSVAIVSLETVPGYGDSPTYRPIFWYAELFLTFLFTIEYGLRLYCVRNPMRYAFSFWGVIDLLSILPTYIAVFAVSSSVHSFVMLRSIRLLRVFRVLKLWRMMNDADELSSAIWKARNKIVVFLAVVMVAITISGTLMYYIEHVVPEIIAMETGTEAPRSKFTSIPQSMYWATVTMTTVGYGDITPTTALGKVISAVLILLGYSLIIVPSGFVTAELTAKLKPEAEEIHPCPGCEAPHHRVNAEYCDRCGTRLES